MLTALLAAVLISDATRIAEMAAVRSAAEARELLAVWPEETSRTAAFLLGFDFLYDVVHNNAVALASIGTHPSGAAAASSARGRGRGRCGSAPF